MIETTKNLMNDFNNTSLTMGKLTDIIVQLSETHKKFNTLVKSHKWEHMQEVYQTLASSFTTWGTLRLTRQEPAEADRLDPAVHAQDVQVHAQRVRRLQ